MSWNAFCFVPFHHSLFHSRSAQITHIGHSQFFFREWTSYCHRSRLTVVGCNCGHNHTSEIHTERFWFCTFLRIVLLFLPTACYKLLLIMFSYCNIVCVRLLLQIKRLLTYLQALISLPVCGAPGEWYYNTLLMLRLCFIVKCGISQFLCAMRVFDVRASSSPPSLSLRKISFLLQPRSLN